MNVDIFIATIKMLGFKVVPNYSNIYIYENDILEISIHPNLNDSIHVSSTKYKYHSVFYRMDRPFLIELLLNFIDKANEFTELHKYLINSGFTPITHYGILQKGIIKIYNFENLNAVRIISTKTEKSRFFNVNKNTKHLIKQFIHQENKK